MAFCAKCGKELPAAATFCPACGTPVPGSAPAGAAGSTAAPISGMDAVIKEPKAQQYWIQRVIAYAIDAVIIAVALGIIALIVAVPFFLTGGFSALTGFFFGGFAVLAGIVLIFYFPFMETMYGASLGKRIMSLKVVSKAGTNPTFLEAFVRNVSKIYWLLLLLDVIIGLAVTKGYQQKYSDHMMGTTVVHT